MKIISNKKIAKDTYEMILVASNIKQITPGQFMHLKSGREDLLLRRPISIANFDSRKMSLIYKVVGQGTASIANFIPNDKIDVLGPLGQGFKIMNFKEVLIVGGGMGVAPLYQLGKELVEKDVKVNFVLGFSSKEHIYYLDKFMALGEVIITTEDGSFGLKGHVGDVIDQLKEFEAVYACGPLPLLTYLQNKFKKHPHLYLSLEQRMACGIGACYGCDTKDKKYRICTDGPVFNASEVEL